MNGGRRKEERGKLKTKIKGEKKGGKQKLNEKKRRKHTR